LHEADTLSAAAIREGLPTCTIGQHVVYYETIDSTNRVAKELGRAGAPEGTLVIAEAQTSGRGRLNRQWLAPPGSSLLMSLLFRPTMAPLQAARLTMVCSLAVADAIEATTPLHAALKWPNDILLGDKKAGGILTELGLRDERLEFVVVGIGLNVNVAFCQEAPAYPPDAAPDTSQASLGALAEQSTSILQEVGRAMPRLPLLRHFLAQVERRYLALRAGWLPNQEWSRRLATLGQVVTVAAPDGALTGLAEGVDADGALLIRLADCSVVRVLAGDVTIRPAT